MTILDGVSPDGVGDALRRAMPVPTDTMITLDLPLLLTKLSQVPGRTILPDSDEAPSQSPTRR